VNELRYRVYVEGEIVAGFMYRADAHEYAQQHYSCSTHGCDAEVRGIASVIDRCNALIKTLSTEFGLRRDKVWVKLMIWLGVKL